VEGWIPGRLHEGKKSHLRATIMVSWRGDGGLKEEGREEGLNEHLEEESTELGDVGCE
jgi:hypothetical protein